VESQFSQMARYGGVYLLIGFNGHDLCEQCQSMSASPVTLLVLNLRAYSEYYYRVDQSKERTEYMCVTARECSCSRHI
jgi:hypothetical protein